MNAVEMFARCRDRQGAQDADAEREYQIAKEIGTTLRAAGLGVTRPAEASDSLVVMLPEPMGNGEPGMPMEAMWA